MQLALLLQKFCSFQQHASIPESSRVYTGIGYQGHRPAEVRTPHAQAQPL